jgi:hypothetical protein
MNDCTFTHCAMSGLCVTKNAQAVSTNCRFAWNVKAGVRCMGQNTAIMVTDCQFYRNNEDGVIVHRQAVVNVYGELTESYSNNTNGLSASECGVINIHLPQSHVISHDNFGININMNVNNGNGETCGLIQNCNLCHFCIQRKYM